MSHAKNAKNAKRSEFRCRRIFLKRRRGKSITSFFLRVPRGFVRGKSAGKKFLCVKTSPPFPLPLRFCLPFSRVRLDAAREMLAERGGRAPHACALISNRDPHRRIAHVSERRRRSFNRITVDPPKVRVSARNSASSALSVISAPNCGYTAPGVDAHPLSFPA